MNCFLQKLNRIFRRKFGRNRKRGLFGTPLFAAAREEAEKQAAESHHAERFVCGTFLTRMADEEAENHAPVYRVPEAMKDQRNDHAQEETKK